jgi:hypothetical protein
MFRFAFLINPPVPLLKGGTCEDLRVVSSTHGRNEQRRSVSFPPLFKKGGQGGFYSDAHSFQSEHIYENSYKLP